MVTSFTVILVIYLKLVEERELEARFGNDYLEYKSRTPFIPGMHSRPSLVRQYHSILRRAEP